MAKISITFTRRRTNPMRMLLAAYLLIAPVAGVAGPEEDRQAFRDFYARRFPDVPLAAHKDGTYALNAGKRQQWLDIEDFPPYEIAVDEGEELFGTPFANGGTYADCFDNGGLGIKQHYPYFDTDLGEVVTLEMAVNLCRERNQEKPLDYASEELNAIVAYMAFTSRGEHFDIRIPDDPRALAAHEEGRRFYFTRRGQLNFACSSCSSRSRRILSAVSRSNISDAWLEVVCSSDRSAVISES